MKQYKWWIALGLVIITCLAVYLLQHRKSSMTLLDYVPQNAAFVIQSKAESLTDAEIQTLANYGIPPKMLRQLVGHAKIPGPLFNQPLVLFGELTPAGPAVGILLAPEDISLFQERVESTRYTGTSINKKDDVQFMELNTGLYLSWNENIALLSYQLTSGEAYPLAIFNRTLQAVDLPIKLKTDAEQCMLKPVSIMQMLNHEKPSPILTAISGIIPQQTTLLGKLKTRKGALQLDMDVIDGAKELEALLKNEPGQENYAAETSEEQNGTFIYLALQKPMIASIAALAGQTGNPLLGKLNGNAGLWLPASESGKDQPWMLWLGAAFTEQEKAMLKQLPLGMSYSPLAGINMEMAGNCLLLKPTGQAIYQTGFQKPKNPLELHLRSPENALNLTGNSHSMQLQIEATKVTQTPLSMLLNALGSFIPKAQP